MQSRRYIPGAPVNDEVKKANGNLPGMGGVFNVVNFHLYHYAGNNPVKYTDPDGKVVLAGTLVLTTIPAWVPYVATGVASVLTALGISEAINNAEENKKPKTPDAPTPVPPKITKPEEGAGVKEAKPEVMPTPEELEEAGKNKQKEIAASNATTETPWVPNEVKPAGEEPPPGIGPKIFWGAGKLLELINNLIGK